MFKVLKLLLINMTFCQAVTYKALIQEQWDVFKLEYEKTYNSKSEEQYRRSVYIENVLKINEHNKLYHTGLTSYQMDINKFGDISGDEFLRIMSMQLSDIEDDEDEYMDDSVIDAPFTYINTADPPEHIDWREKGAVTAVKDQGDCKSCWSFSATGVLEGQWYRKTKRLVSLSEQNLIDCSWLYRNHGCNGGLASKALRYIKKNGGINTEVSYPYIGKDSHECRYKPEHLEATVKYVNRVPKFENQLKKRVSDIGPMAASIELSKKIQFYHRGVFNDQHCRNNLSHAVLVVGYGNDENRDYWLVKNSWSKKWGEEGYIRMSRNKNNQCGIANRVVYPVV